MPQEYDPITKKMKIVNANKVCLVLKDYNNNILAEEVLVSSGYISVRGYYRKYLEFHHNISKYLNF